VHRGQLVIVGALLGALAMPTPAHAARALERTWHGKQIKAYDAMAAGRYGKDVVVAVLDGWVDTQHPDFQGRFQNVADCHTGTCTTGSARDECGSNHGTHVAGTIASTSFGIAPRATLMPVRVLSKDTDGGCTGDADGVAAGIKWAVAHGAHVINLSLGPDVPGLGSTSAIPKAVHEAAQANVVMVFSAGNANLPVAQDYGDDALVVAATGPSGRLADYSQHGQGVSVAAPGGQPTKNAQGKEVCYQDGSNCITSTYPDNRHAVAAGTSMAAPHVAGLAALLIGQRPSRSRQNVLDRITGTAHALSGAGAGLVDAKRALGVTTAAPSPSAKPKPRPSATRPPAVIPKATQTPQPVTTSAAPRPSSSPKPVVAVPQPGKSTSPLVVAPAPVGGIKPLKEPIPLPLAGLAGGLAGLAGAAVVLAGLTAPARRRG